MKRYYVLLLVSLTGCMAAYEPKLAAGPANQQRYESDLSACKSEARSRILAAGYSAEGMTKSAVSGAFGLAGSGVVAMVSSRDDDYSKSGFRMVDECMSHKGYDVAGN